jgi:hypothetical protein
VTAGIVAAIAGFVAFLVIHHVWIAPIWFIAPVGAPMAAGGGAVVGIAYAELLPGLPARPLRTAAVAVGALLVLAPGAILAELFGPIYEMWGGSGVLLVPVGQALALFVFGLFATAMLVGAALGAAIGRTRRAAGWSALAALALAVGPGHNIPMLGATSVVAKELAIIATVAALSAWVLVAVHARQTANRPSAI